MIIILKNIRYFYWKFKISKVHRLNTISVSFGGTSSNKRIFFSKERNRRVMSMSGTRNLTQERSRCS